MSSETPASDLNQTENEDSAEAATNLEERTLTLSESRKSDSSNTPDASENASSEQEVAVDVQTSGQTNFDHNKSDPSNVQEINENGTSEQEDGVDKQTSSQSKNESKSQIETGSDVGTMSQADWEYVIPQREILLPDEIESVWEKSQAYNDLLGFIMAMSDAVKGKKMRDEYSTSQTIEKLLSVLDTFNTYIDENPPDTEEIQRFGNTAYRTWFSKMAQNCEGLVQGALDEQFHPAVSEISVYLREGMGNATRIDYGTGHEMAFTAFLCCLYKIGALVEADAVATVFTLFQRYLELMRRLQQTYRMEPAGSQGVWNLDDFSFLPFIYGAAQLIEHARLKPKHYPDKEMCETFSKDYMLFAAVLYIHKVKTGPFHEHSNQLWNISGVKLWAKVHGGLIKMYKAEVLNKFPVIQHFLFGSLMSVEPVSSPR